MSLCVTAFANAAEKHEYDVTSLIFQNEKVYSSADDGKIKMWSKDLKLEKEIQAHPYSIYSLATDRKVLYSCSSDGSVRSWKLNTLDKVAVIQEPGEREMWKLYWSDDVLLVGDDQGIVYLFKNNRNTSQVEMLEQIKDIAFKDNLLYTVRDLDVSITEIIPGDKGRFMSRRTLTGRSPLCLLSDKICYSGRDGFDIHINGNKGNNFKDIALIKGAHEMVINALTGYEKDSETYILSGGWDKIIKQWRLVSDGGITNAGSCAVDGYINVLCVNMDENVVYAGGADGKMWKFKITN